MRVARGGLGGVAVAVAVVALAVVGAIPGVTAEGADATLRGEIQARLRGWGESSADADAVADADANADKPKKTAVVTDVVQSLFVASEPVSKYYLCPDPLDSKCAVRFRRLPVSPDTGTTSAASSTTTTTTTLPKFAIFSAGKKPKELLSSIDANGKPQVAWAPKASQAPWGPTHANNSWIVTRVSEWVDYAVVGLNVGGRNYVLTVSDPLNDDTNRELVMAPFYGINFADDNMMATAVWVVARNL